MYAGGKGPVKNGSSFLRAVTDGPFSEGGAADGWNGLFDLLAHMNRRTRRRRGRKGRGKDHFHASVLFI